MLKMAQKGKIKIFIILLIFFLACGAIFVNSLYLDGLNYVRKTLYAEKLVEEVCGYRLEGNEFIL